MEQARSLLFVIQQLRKKGYQYDFSIAVDSIRCDQLRLTLAPDSFHVDFAFRFDELSSVDESAVLYAVTTVDGTRGIMVDSYGVYSEAIDSAMAEKLRIDGKTMHRLEDVI